MENAEGEEGESYYSYYSEEVDQVPDLEVNPHSESNINISSTV